MMMNIVQLISMCNEYFQIPLYYHHIESLFFALDFRFLEKHGELERKRKNIHRPFLLNSTSIFRQVFPKILF